MKYFTELWKESKQKFAPTQYKKRCEWITSYLAMQLREDLTRWIPIEEYLPEELVNKKTVTAYEWPIFETDAVLVKCEDKRYNRTSYHIAWRQGSIDNKRWMWASNSNDFTASDIVGWRRIESL